MNHDPQLFFYCFLMFAPSRESATKLRTSWLDANGPKQEVPVEKLWTLKREPYLNPPNRPWRHSFKRFIFLAKLKIGSR